MEFATLEARVASYEPPTKRSKSGWPHTSPTAQDLAKAGFYYKPQGSGSDNVICYMCERALDGWEEDDDPAQEHIKHSPACGWAILLNAGQDVDVSNMEDPTGTRMTEARRATFAAGWPHESKRGWTCKTEKMVEAGWHFAPIEEVKTFDEHQRRSPECPFFVFAGSTAPNKRPKAKKGRASKTARTSKASSRLSSQSNTSVLSMGADVSSIPDLDESIDTSGISNMSTMSTASTATNKGKRKATGGRKKAGTSKKAKTAKTTKPKVIDAEPEPEHEPEGMEIDLGPSPHIEDPLPDPEVDLEADIPMTEQLAEPVPQEVIKESIEYDGVKEQEPSPSPAPKKRSILYPELRQSSTLPAPKTSPMPASSHEPLHTQTPPKSTGQNSPSQNSDIENAPPSSLPASVRPPLSSPGESMPVWEAVDVEMVFQPVHPGEIFGAREDLFESDGELSEEEKSMTVQEWIEFIAHKAEESLRLEGERVVGVFEEEGRRAMGVLEGMICS